jgi:hypothetical protein
MIRRSSRFLDPAKIDAALAEIARAVDAHKVALAGGVALQAWGSDRFTANIDVISSTRIPLLKNRAQPLAFGGDQTVAGNGVPVDVIRRTDDYKQLYGDALASAARVEGIPLRVVTLPFLAAMKMAAGRGEDKADLEWILVESSAEYADVRRVVRDYLGTYAATELDADLDLARWQKKRSKKS